MATLFSDNFNRADSQSLGASWTEERNSGAGGNEILSNRLRLKNSPSNPGMVQANTTAHAAVADCKVTVTRVAGTSFDAGPVVRSNGSGVFYALDVYGSNTLEIYRHSAYTTSTLVAARTQTHANGDTYSLQVSGTGGTVTLKIFRNGVQVGADITDTSGSRITAAGQTGVYTWSASPDFDDYLVEDLATGQTADVPVGLVDVLGVAPATLKSSAVPIGLADLLGITFTPAKSAALTPGLVDVAALAPETTKAAPVPPGLVDVTGAPLVESQTADVTVGLVDVAAIAPTYTILASGDDAEWDNASLWDETAVDASIGSFVFGTILGHAWLRFETQVPAGATVEEAVLLVTKVDSNSATGTVAVEDADSAIMPTDQPDAEARTLTTGTALSLSGAAGIVVATDITADIQEVVDRPGFDGTLNIAILGESGGADIYLSDSGASVAPRLRIKFPSVTTPYTSAVGTGLVDVTAVAPDTDKLAAATPGLVDVLSVTFTPVRSYAVDTGLVDITGISPGAAKSAALDAVLIDVVAAALNEANSVEVDAVVVEVVAVDPGTPHLAGLDAGLVDVTGVSPGSAKSAVLAPGLVDLLGLTPDTDKSASVAVGAVVVVGVAPDTDKSASVAVGLVDVLGVTPGVMSTAAVGVGLVELVGLTPGTAKTTGVDVGLVEVIGVTVTVPGTEFLAVLYVSHVPIYEVEISHGRIYRVDISQIPVSEVAL